MNTTVITVPPDSLRVSFEREFDAPPSLVFRAHTDPELYAQWIGPRRLSTTIEEFDVRHGGTWHFTQQGDDQVTHAFRGVFHGTPSVENGIVQTFEYEGMPGHVMLDSLTFEDLGGRTRLRGTSVSQTAEARDAMVEGGMEGGMVEGYERLDELIARLAPV
ncbi:MAG: hypothetical protein JWL64_897 [Frankiales bacterium]|nr:hypothetical protein [Frankiales bacterium]